jgi:hypothetical protein
LSDRRTEREKQRKVGIGPRQHTASTIAATVSDAVKAVGNVEERFAERMIACAKFLSESTWRQVCGLRKACTLEHVKRFDVERSVPHKSSLFRARCTKNPESRAQSTTSSSHDENRKKCRANSNRNRRKPRTARTTE